MLGITRRVKALGLGVEAPQSQKWEEKRLEFAIQRGEALTG